MSTEKITKSFLFYVVPLCLLLSYVLTTCYGADLDELDDRLEARITSIEEQLKLLQDKVDANKWVINVTEITGGRRINFSDGSSVDILHGTNGRDGETGPAGTNGTSWSIGSDNTWMRDGENTGMYATGPSPIILDGKWAFIQWSNTKVDYDTIVSKYVADTLASYIVDWGQYYELFMPVQDSVTVTDPETGLTTKIVRLQWRMIELPKYRRDLNPPLVFKFLGYARVINDADTVQLLQSDLSLNWWYLDSNELRDWNGNVITEDSSLWKWKWRVPRRDIVTDSFIINELSANKYAVLFSINRPGITNLDIKLIDSRGLSLDAVVLEKAKFFDNGLITKASSNNDTVYYARMKTLPYFPGSGSLDQQKGKIYYRLLVDTFKSELSPYPIELRYKYDGLQKATVSGISQPGSRVVDTFKIAYDDKTTAHTITFNPNNPTSLFDYYIQTDSIRIALAPPQPTDSILRTFRLDSTLTPPATYKFPIYVYMLHVDGTTNKDTVWVKAE
jgi:hypothetical protein